jgi:hypothetical protein
VNDLGSDDRALWQRYHRGLCPGAAIANFGDGGKSYVLAMLDRSHAQLQEKLVVVKWAHANYSEQVLSPANKTDRVSVVWRLKPGSSYDYATGQTVSVRHDSVVYEVMESAALQFYWTSGKFHTLQTAD